MASWDSFGVISEWWHEKGIHLRNSMRKAYDLCLWNLYQRAGVTKGGCMSQLCHNSVCLLKLQRLRFLCTSRSPFRLADFILVNCCGQFQGQKMPKPRLPRLNIRGRWCLNLVIWCHLCLSVFDLTGFQTKFQNPGPVSPRITNSGHLRRTSAFPSFKKKLAMAMGPPRLEIWGYEQSISFLKPADTVHRGHFFVPWITMARVS